ncbi:MAG: fructosamine kinase family protein [Saprospiraceae bacterium]
MAVDSGMISNGYISKTEKMFHQIEKDMPDAATPTLLHGDLWNGNYMIDTNGKCVIIDPAIYFGHNEIDLAMMKLFGGFDDEVFNIYYDLSIWTDIGAVD